MKPLQNEEGRWYCWGQRLSHNRLSNLTRRKYRCGCEVLLADGWVKYEKHCDIHKGLVDPPAHTWINRF